MSKEKQIEEIFNIIINRMLRVKRGGYIPMRVFVEITQDILGAGYRKQSEWISVDERLPTENGDYLVYVKYGYIEIERYKMWDDDDLDGGYWWELEGRVTHWMPLPEAPKGGAE